MLLESIELQGYKTFAGRTRFEFAGPITCIVGPNGSGKSNIADAIRWVLGEQSYRLLRGKKTEDMIFSGSDVRSRSGMASANITFDNSSGWLPIDFSEVSIARRAYRDGTNEYLLNGQRVRLKDISELLSSSGLSQRTYTIIGQGLVDAALALRAEDRRSLFEEAAGIGLYRSRREEAQRRLETTHHNIERVEDILSELKPRLRSLQRQADRAAQFEQVSSDLKNLLRDYYGYYWYKVQEDLRQAREANKQQEITHNSLQEEHDILETKLETLRGNIHALRIKLGTWHRELGECHLQWEEVTRHLAVSEERNRSLIAQLQQTQNEITRIVEQINQAELQKEQAEKTVDQGEIDFKDAVYQLEKAQQELTLHQAERSAVEGNIRLIQERIAKYEERQRFLKIKQNDQKLEKERLDKVIQETEAGISKITEELERNRIRIEEKVRSQEELKDQQRDAKKALENQIKLRIDHEKAYRKAQENRMAVHSELLKFRAELDAIEKAEKDLVGYGEGARGLLEASKQGKLPGILGALGSHLEVSKELEPAISAALGEYIDSVLIDQDRGEKKPSASLEMALEHLLDRDARGALLPLAKLKPIISAKFLNTSGVIGLASNLVTVASELKPAVDVLLSQTVIVKDRDIALKVLKRNSSIEKAVTLAGEVFHSAGIITVGKKSGSISLSRPHKKRELQNRISTSELEIRSIDEQLVDIDTELATLRKGESERQASLQQLERRELDGFEAIRKAESERNQLQRELAWRQSQYEKLKGEISDLALQEDHLLNNLVELQEQITQSKEELKAALAEIRELSTDEQRTRVNYWNTQVALTEASLKNARERLKDFVFAMANSESTRKELTAQTEALSKGLGDLTAERIDWKHREEGISQKMSGLTELISPSEEELNQAEEILNSLEKEESKARQVSNASYRTYSQAQLTLARNEEKLERLREQIEDDLGLVSLEYDDAVSGPTPLPLEGLVESLPKLRMLPEDMERTIRRQRAQVKRMGAINPEAPQEYEEVKERFSFLTEQIEDLRKAERDVRQVIAELEEIMQQEFQKTFDQVAKEFKEIFLRLFGGGSAQLVLTHPGDLTETGIDIIARLPGRRLQGLSLLSGGERSLTATALVFSLLKVSPTPFCVLDEVDAMLDESNISRFRELLKELAEDTQFILITHNRNTVQVADVIYGVTMGRDSVSQSISLKLDEVAQVV